MAEAAPAARTPFPWATMLVVLAAVGAQGWPDAERTLALVRERVLAGEVWRAWTGHVVHFGRSHLWLNVAVVAPAGAWLERVAPGRARVFYLFTPPLIAAGLLLLQPELATYAGLSGLAAGVLVLLAITQLRRSAGRNVAGWWAVLALVGAKVGFEFMSPGPVFAGFDDPAARSVPLAHVLGIVGAIAVRLGVGKKREPE